jgi:hypothetical protein
MIGMQAFNRGSKLHQPQAAYSMVPTCKMQQLRCNQRFVRRSATFDSRRVQAAAVASPASPATRAGQQQQQQAVVIGSGIAGLAAAEVLSRHFERVVVLERDEPQPEWDASAVDMAKVWKQDSCSTVPRSQGLGSSKHLAWRSMLVSLLPCLHVKDMA